MRPAPAPFPPPPSGPHDRLILPDGAVVAVRLAGPSDVPSVRQLFRALSPTTRRRRFLSGSGAPETAIERLCQTDDPERTVTLLAFGPGPEGPEPIAVASYATCAPATAEVGFAATDTFQGRGLGTALFDHLAGIAVGHGIKWFHACAFSDDEAMFRVFRDSGFEIRSRSDHGVIDLRLNLTPSASGIAAMEERHRVATVASLRPILEPRSVAIVGVSRDPSHMGRQLFDRMLAAGFDGPVHPVNPATETVAGHRCYAAIGDVPGPVDLAVVAVPAAAVPDIVSACGSAGVKGVVVVSAGFADAGEEGASLQRRLRNVQLERGVRLVGPNCVGLLNASPKVHLNASLSPVLPPPGRMAIATQSGGLGLAMLQLVAERGLGLSTFVSLGNKIDVSGNDVLEWAESDPATSVILLYLESFGNPRRFGTLARRIGRHKPVVMIKSGRTSAGGRAAGSHTAGLTSNDAAVDALVRQSGVIRAQTISEMFDVAACLAQQPLPPGPRLAIVSNAGGPGILAADACEDAGLAVEEFSAATAGQLSSGLSSQAAISNPVDMVASAGPAEYRHAIRTALADPETDSLIVIYTSVNRDKDEAILGAIGDSVAEARGSGGATKPVVVSVMAHSAGPKPLPAGSEMLPVYAFPESGVKALGKAWAYARWRAGSTGLHWTFDEIHVEEARALCQDVVAARGNTWLTREELTRVLNAFGLPLAASGVASSAAEAVALAAIIGFPVVLKVSSSEILHKTEIGGIRLNLTSEDAVQRAYKELASLVPESRQGGPPGGVLVQPMLYGVETFVGLLEDPAFGPLVAFGLGGADVEVIRDVAFRMAPLTDRDADELLSSVRGFALLQGHRGQPQADLDALREIVLRVSLIGQHIPEIAELDLNPVMALPVGHGCRVVDGRASVRAQVTAPERQ